MTCSELHQGCRRISRGRGRGSGSVGVEGDEAVEKGAGCSGGGGREASSLRV